jgi:hypothetical protein
MYKKSILYKTLCRALSIKRPHAGKGVALFTDWLEARVPAYLRECVRYDEVGSLHVDARGSATHRTLFVAHVDTMHRDDGANKIRKTKGKWYADADVLGADDGAGVALLMHMLCSRVPAYYVFTQGEERGGIGAKHLAKDVMLLSQFDRAIAFDRCGIDSVITHQGWGRCCSDTFAQALADDLSAGNVLMYLGDDTGVYTDTAEFVDTIPECTNVSVGYMYEHSVREELNIHHFTALADAVLTVAWDALPTDRDPAVFESKWKLWNTAAVIDYKEDALDEYPLEMEVQDALYRAKRGYYKQLVALIAEAVYPEDPVLAQRTIDRQRLTAEVLEEALDSTAAQDAHDVLCWLYDTAYCTT